MTELEIEKHIQQYVRRLPSPLKAEVLDFVEFLISKTAAVPVLQESRDWSQFSLESAMRELDDESITYSESDLKVIYE